MNKIPKSIGSIMIVVVNLRFLISKKFLKGMAMHMNFSYSRTPQQNGIVERKNWVLQGATRTI